MLSVEENELVSRVGPGTPVGNLMREYWIPAMLSSELASPDSDPVRIMLLGEQLIAFRDTAGQVGLLPNLCPHRGASLFFGRNEEQGLRCVYHGWKFDVTGHCIDMPNEPPESNFKSRIKATAYPCAERGGVVWAYLGPKEVPPSLPSLPGNMFDEGEYEVTAAQRECNWLQALEGDIDTSHTNFLHTGALQKEEFPEDSIWYYALRDRAPKFTAAATEFGVVCGAFRPAGPGQTYWRISQFLFPFHIHLGGPGNRTWVPMDDGHVMFYSMNRKSRSRAGANDLGQIMLDDPLLPNTTDWYGRFRPAGQVSNDFLIDRAVQRSGKSFTGIPGGFAPQDAAVTVSMGPILDRTIENLGTTDTMIIRVRQRIIDAANALAMGKESPPGAEDAEVYRDQGAGRIIMPESAGLMEASADLNRKPLSPGDLEIPWPQVDRT